MAITVRKNIQLRISRTTAGTFRIFDNFEDSGSEITDSTGFKNANAGTLEMAASEVQVIPLGDVTDPRGFLIQSDQDFTLRVNGGAETTLVRKSGATGSIAEHYSTSAVTAIEITNGATPATGAFAVWGDPAA